MAAGEHSFIDIVARDEVREHFAAGDALLLLDAGLGEVLWTNGPGAALFGAADVGSMLGAESPLGIAARRQIQGLKDYPRIGRDRPVMVRMGAVAVTFHASHMRLGGDDAILLCVPTPRRGAADPDAVARRSIGGFSEPGQFLAVIDGDGQVAAASDGFERLGITRDTLAALVADVKRESDRLLKRLIPGARGRIPAGFVRLTDDPARHLLVAVDEAMGDRADLEGASEPAAPAPAETAMPDKAEELPADGEQAAPIHAPGLMRMTDETASADPQASAAVDEPAEEITPPPTEPEEAVRAAGPVRFVWRTDAGGLISEVSPDLARVVGEDAAAVVGRSFADVCADFGMDPAGEIVRLLERRDTWSGRSLLWPVAGTDLRVPVDLAALPVYDRARNFEGFRGFGVARAGDAIVDADARGLMFGVEAAVLASAEEDLAAVAPEAVEPAVDAQPPVTAADEAPKHEPPSLRLVPKSEQPPPPLERVVRLADHRPAANDRGSLSQGEQNAFREIGNRLRRANEDEAGTSEAPSAETPGADAAKDVATRTSEALLPAQAVPDAAVSEAGIEPGANDAETATAIETVATAPDASVREALAAASPDEVVPVSFGAPDDALPVEPAERRQPAVAEDVATVIEAPPAVVAGDEPTQSGTAETDAIEIRDPEDPAAGMGAAQADAVQPEPEPASSDDEAPDEGPAVEAHADEAAEEEEFLPSAFADDGRRKRPPVDTSILDRLPVPVLIHAGDVLHYANRDFLELTAYESIEALADRGGLGALFAEPYPAEEYGGDRKLRLIRGDGLELPVEAFLQSVPWNKGSALLLSLRRIGRAPMPPASAPAPEPQSQPQPGLENRLAELRTIIDTATDGVILIAEDGTIRSISRPAEALFGLDSEQVTGKPFVSLFAIESQRAARDYLTGLSDNGVKSVLNDGREVIGREAEGRFIPLFMTIGRLPDKSGYCAVVRDITQWKRAEEELTQARAQAERSSSQKTEFLARVSHEIRTPLNAIIGFSELMMDEKFGPVGNDRYRDYLRDINRSGNHVLDLVNDLLDISKIEAGQQEMSYEAVALNDTLAESVAMMQPQANRERVIIRSSFASGLPDVVADLRTIRQIALNLLSNAIRYTQAGGQVIVSTAYDVGGDVVMRFRDTGIGMSPAELEQALKPFKQINAIKRPRGDGTGLGLPLTKAMVEANRARFTILSTPGEGTLVEITFPSTRVLAN